MEFKLRLSYQAFIILIFLSNYSFTKEYKTVVPSKDGTSMTTNGIITPLDQEMKNFYLRNADGAIEVKLKENVQIGIQARMNRYRHNKSVKGDVYKGWEERLFIPEFYSAEQMAFKLPKDLYMRVNFKDWNSARRALKDPKRDIWNGRFYTEGIAEHLPTEGELWLSGKVIKNKKKFTSVIKVGDKEFRIACRGHDNADIIIGVMSTKDIKPFVQQGFVRGEMKGDVFYADELTIRPLPIKEEDPKLPRYLYIGDSMSGNYAKALEKALKGKFNIVHPPTNCGNSGKGLANIAQWMGPYDQKGKQWDIISFNFGHWDSNSTKDLYQSNLRGIISQLKKTGAKLIYVTTCPVPGGYEKIKDSGDQKAEGRLHLNMKKYINPWALEVMAQHPEISICDQWSFVANEKFYQTWFTSAKDVHLPGLLAEPFGRQLARTVLDVMGQKDTELKDSEIEAGTLDDKRLPQNLKNLDFKDFKDLINNNERLRQYNSIRH